MKLSNFKSYISPAIVGRGQEYYNDQAVKDLTELKNGKWMAIVEGTVDYEVDVTIDEKREVTHFFCNCPYDGDVCKHVVAVLLAIEDESIDAIGEKSQKKSPEWQQIIKYLPEDELRSFIIEFAARNEKLKNELIINFPALDQADNSDKYRNIISESFNSATDRHGYIDYRDTYAAMHPIDNLLAKADEHIEKANYREAFSIASAVAPECIKAIQYFDDSDGECGGAIEDAFQIIDTILEKSKDTSFTDEVYEWLCEQMENSEYGNYGCDDHMEHTFFNRAINPVRISNAYEYIEKQLIKAQSKEGWSAEYDITLYLKHKIELLQKEGKDQEADKLIDDNIYYSDFRKIRVEQRLEQKDYDQATLLLKEGIKIAEQENYSGIVHHWKEQLLSIYKSTNNISELQKISLNLFEDNPGTMEYYRIYKKTIPKNDWPQTCEMIIQKLLPKKQKSNFFTGHLSHNLANIYIEEKMWNRLFDAVKTDNRIYTISNYTKYLKADFSNEVINLYKEGILEYAQKTGRDVYKQLVSYLSKMAALEGGFDEAKLLMIELLEEYKNRPAMKDEFNALNWG